FHSCQFSEVAAGLLYLHSRAPPVIHGDIRGVMKYSVIQGNILVTADSKCVLADFGLSVVYTESQIWSMTTTTGANGTLRWMAPELLNPDESDNSALHHPSVDVYAFGSTVVEILTLKPPFYNKTDFQVMQSVSQGQRPPQPQQNRWCPDALWELVEACWAQDPAARPNIQKLYDTLQQIKI
ncbi:hypothetical protein GYMLUDRAFT_982306, partial [Collybiopsis luxurians FD-317 M1]